MKGMSEQRISSNPPYGYIKGEGGQLVPDPEAAWVVKLMFDCSGSGKSGIGKPKADSYFCT